MTASPLDPTAVLVLGSGYAYCDRCGQEVRPTDSYHAVVAGSGGGRPGCGARFDRITTDRTGAANPHWRVMLDVVRPDLRVVDPVVDSPLETVLREREDHQYQRDWFGVAVALLLRNGGRIEFDALGDELAEVRRIMDPRQSETQLISWGEKLSNKIVVELRTRPRRTDEAHVETGDRHG